MRILLSFLLLLPTAAHAADRRVFVTSFDRIRVEGPFQVTVTVGRSPGATISGDARQLDQTEVRVDGTTLVVRPALDGARGLTPRATTPVTVTLATPGLRGAAVLGGGALTIAGSSRAARVDLSIAGAGSIGWSGVDAAQANATVIGNGAIALAGRAAATRLSINGAGRIDAGGLDASELTVRVDGPGETIARARYTATVTNTGLGKVTVAGSPKCIVHSAAGGPVTCGAGATGN